jgi:hypothetical protein
VVEDKATNLLTQPESVRARGGKVNSSEKVAFAITANGIFYSTAPVSRNQHLIRFLNFSTGQSRPVVVTDRQIHVGLSVSPDQRFLVFAQHDQTGSDLMLIENFENR